MPYETMKAVETAKKKAEAVKKLEREAKELKHINEMLKLAEAKGIGVETEAIKLKHQAEKVEQIAKENSRLK